MNLMGEASNLRLKRKGVFLNAFPVGEASEKGEAIESRLDKFCSGPLCIWQMAFKR